MSNLDWSQCPVVESVPGKLSGAWVLKGTRMPASAIFKNIAAGANIDDIMEWFDGLDRERLLLDQISTPRLYRPRACCSVGHRAAGNPIRRFLRIPEPNGGNGDTKVPLI
jgi:uncharacterized protein (DUF433 family)